MLPEPPNPPEASVTERRPTSASMPFALRAFVFNAGKLVPPRK